MSGIDMLDKKLIEVIEEHLTQFKTGEDIIAGVMDVHDVLDGVYQHFSDNIIDVVEGVLKHNKEQAQANVEERTFDSSRNR